VLRKNPVTAGAALALALVLASSSARAEMTVQRYAELAASGRQIIADLYLMAVMEGFEGMELDPRQPRNFFCLPPANDTSDLEPYRAAIRKELADRGDFWRQTPDASLGKIAFEAFRRQFPCK